MTPPLSLDSVTKRFGAKRVLSGVTFFADAGEVLGVIGPNGAGKTTLLRIVVGLIRPQGGIVQIDGERVPAALSRVRTGYFAGEWTMAPGVRARTWRRLFHDVDDYGENRPLRILSRGTRQLLGLRTLFTLAGLKLIVLDEPWEGLDPDASRWLTEAIRARRDAGATILVSSHRLHDLAGVCDRYVFLHRGVATVVSARAVSKNGRVTGDALLTAFDDIRGNGR